MLLFYFSVLPVGFRVLGNLQLCVNSRLGGKSSSMYQLPDGSISAHTHTQIPPYKTIESLSNPVPLSNHTHNHFYPHHKASTHRAAGVKTVLGPLTVCVRCLKIICPQDRWKKLLHKTRYVKQIVQWYDDLMSFQTCMTSFIYLFISVEHKRTILMFKQLFSVKTTGCQMPKRAKYI